MRTISNDKSLSQIYNDSQRLQTARIQGASLLCHAC